MKVSKKHLVLYLVLYLVLISICTIGVNCVDVDAPQGNGASEVVTLGGSEGRVLLHHPNGKFYVVELQTRMVSEVTDLPTVSKPMKTY